MYLVSGIKNLCHYLVSGMPFQHGTVQQWLTNLVLIPLISFIINTPFYYRILASHPPSKNSVKK